MWAVYTACEQHTFSLNKDYLHRIHDAIKGACVVSDKGNIAKQEGDIALIAETLGRIIRCVEFVAYRLARFGEPHLHLLYSLQSTLLYSTPYSTYVTYLLTLLRSAARGCHLLTKVAIWMLIANQVVTQICTVPLL